MNLFQAMQPCSSSAYDQKLVADWRLTSPMFKCDNWASLALAIPGIWRFFRPLSKCSDTWEHYVTYICTRWILEQRLCCTQCSLCIYCSLTVGDFLFQPLYLGRDKFAVPIFANFYSQTVPNSGATYAIRISYIICQLCISKRIQWLS